MALTAKQAAEHYVRARSLPVNDAPPAFDVLHAELRERYARGAINLERLEAEFVLLLKMDAALDSEGAERP